MFAEPTFSVSGVTLAWDCLTKWAYRYLLGLRSPPDPSAVIGTRVHSVAEEYLRSGTPPDPSEQLVTARRTVYPGRIFAPGIPHLPAPGTSVVEGEIRFRTVNVQWVGYRDFVSQLDNSTLIGDHKTTGDLGAHYLENERTLIRNPQACLYSEKAYQDGAQNVDALWVYYQTRGAYRARPVRARMQLPVVQEVVGRLDETAVSLTQLLRDKPDVKDLDRNYATCSKYGGCPHRGVQCRHTTAQLMPRGPMENKPLSLLERMRQLREQNSSKSAASVETKPAEDLTDRQAQNLVAEHLAAQGKDPSLAYPQPEAGRVNPSESAGLAPKAEPDAPAAPAATAATTAETVDPTNLEALDRNALKAVALQLGLMTTSDRWGVERIREALHAHRAQREGKAESPKADTRAESPKADTRAESPKADTRAEAAPIWELFVDCLPYGEYVSAFSLYRDACVALRSQGIEQDYRLVEFGKGRGLLASALRQIMQGRQYTAVVVESRAPEMADCLATLCELAEGRVVRALR